MAARLATATSHIRAAKCCTTCVVSSESSNAYFPSCKRLELEHLKLLHGMFLCVSAISAEASFKSGTGHQLAQCRRRPASFLNQAFLITKSLEFSNIHLSTSSQLLVSPRKRSHCCLPCLLGNMSKTAQATRNTITLKGSTKVVTEFFAYAVNRWVLNIMMFNAKTTISLTSLEQSRRPLSVMLPLWQINRIWPCFDGMQIPLQNPVRIEAQYIARCP